MAGGGDLYVGTSSTEWVVSGADATKAKAAIASRYGSARIQARFIGASLLFVTPASRAIRQLGQSGPPITEQSDHMVRSGIVQMDFAQSPDMAIFAVAEKWTDGAMSRRAIYERYRMGQNKITRWRCY